MEEKKIIIVDDEPSYAELANKANEEIAKHRENKKEILSKSELFKDPRFMPSMMWDKENNRPIGISYKRNIRKVCRNEPCPCKSGRKWKHCHGR